MKDTGKYNWLRDVFYALWAWQKNWLSPLDNYQVSSTEHY